MDYTMKSGITRIRSDPMVHNARRWTAAMINVVVCLLVRLTADFRSLLSPLFRPAPAGIQPALLVFVFFGVVAAGSFFPFSAIVVQAAPAQLEPVTLQLRWSHQFQFAGYYAAIEKGYYADEGLQVSLREFEPGTDRIAPVLEGKAQYGVGDPSLLKLRMQGKPVVVLAQILQHSPSVLIARRENGIFSADELVGRRVMLPLDDIGSAAIQAMIRQEAGDLNRIAFVPHTYNDKKFINGDVDAMSA